jgi:hypothetical protein
MDDLLREYHRQPRKHGDRHFQSGSHKGTFATASTRSPMKNKLAIVLAAVFGLTACNTAQLGASAAFIGGEVATAQILAKNPSVLPVAQAIVADWAAFQGGKLTSAGEAALLQQIVAATKGQVTPTEAALLDGAVQQILANQNATAPTPLQGAAGAIITDVVNGIARGIAVYTTPATS